MEKIIADRPVLAETHKRFGLYTGLALVGVSLLFILTKFNNTDLGRWLPLALLIGGIMGNAFAFSGANGRVVTFGQIFSSSFKTTAIVTLIMMAWALLSLYLFPQMNAEFADLLRRGIEAQKEISEEERREALATAAKYPKLIYASEVLFPCMFTGLLAALIGGLLAPKIKKSV